MDWRDSPDEASFRRRLREWLATHRPPPLPHDPDERMNALNAWHRELYDGGWIGLSFPIDDGGHGLAPTYEAILNDELGAGALPPPPPIGHLANAIRLFGNDDQRQQFLPDLLSGRVRWCQGFSEPGAGSDLGGVSTRAALVDGSYRVTGQKVWTSEALWSQWCLLLVRTESDEPAHRALSILLVPLDTPGVEVRPIVTASGTREFAEVFFDGATVPTGHLLGAPGHGWSIAMALLGYERGPADVGWVARLARLLTDAEQEVRSGSLDASEAQRLALAREWVQVRALQVHVARTLSDRLDGSTPGPEGSIDKLLMTAVDQSLNHALFDLRGASSVLDERAAMEPYLWSRAQSIFGGTQQIQRNIVATRVLGLPRQ
jgi:alkylation response protein AidB-like acyl-CoA dehydrogenase